MTVSEVVEVESQKTEQQAIGIINTNGQFLSFILDNEEYCVDILSVEEIRCWEKPTLVPNSPRDIKGVTNLRGKIVPIMDLREKFQIGNVEYSPSVVVIVLKSLNLSRSRIIGIVVDAVSEVINIEDEQIAPCPDAGKSLVSKYMLGISNVNDRVVSIINVDQLLSIDIGRPTAI